MEITPTPRRLSSLEVFLAVVVVALFLGLVAYGAAGLRGSDQFWYSADVESLTHRRGVATNNLFPVVAYTPGIRIPRPFVHNVLNVYLAVPFAALFGAYAGWVLLNVVASLLTALITFMVVRRYSSNAWGLLAGACYLLFPLAVWQTSQPLAEASIPPFIALALLTYLTAQESFGPWLLLEVLAGLLLFCRQSYAPLLLAAPVACALRRTDRRGFALLQAALLLILAVLFVLPEGRLFPQYVEAGGQGFMGRLFSGPTGRAGFPFGFTPKHVTLSDLVNDGMFTARRTVQVHELRVLAGIAGLAVAVAAAVRAVRKRWLPVRLVLALGLFLLLDVAVAVLHQYQARYVLAWTPVFISAGVLLISRWPFIQRGARWVFCLVLVAAVTVPVSAVLARRSRATALISRSEVLGLSEYAKEAIPNNDVVMVDGRSGPALGSYLWLGYALRPRTTLYVPDYYSFENYETLIRRTSARWLVCGSGSEIVDVMGLGPESGVHLPIPNNKLLLYRLSDWSRVFSAKSPSARD